MSPESPGLTHAAAQTATISTDLNVCTRAHSGDGEAVVDAERVAARLREDDPGPVRADDVGLLRLEGEQLARGVADPDLGLRVRHRRAAVLEHADRDHPRLAGGEARLRRRAEPDRGHAPGVGGGRDRERGDDRRDEDEQLLHAASLSWIGSGSGRRRRSVRIVAAASAAARPRATASQPVREAAVRGADHDRLERVRLGAAVLREPVVDLVRVRALAGKRTTAW